MIYLHVVFIWNILYNFFFNKKKTNCVKFFRISASCAVKVVLTVSIEMEPSLENTQKKQIMGTHKGNMNEGLMRKHN